MNNRETEARNRWGDTEAYREHAEKTKDYTNQNWSEASAGLMKIFAGFAVCKNGGARADSAEAQALAARLQAHISENYYTCTDGILACLGRMYTSDERFRVNIDKYGAGTAEFAAASIEAYCKMRGIQ